MGGKGLAFRLLGEPGEVVVVTVVAPATHQREVTNRSVAHEEEDAVTRAMAGTILVLHVAIGLSGQASVVCGVSQEGHCDFPTVVDGY